MNPDFEYNGWKVKDYVQYVNDMIEFMQTCGNQQCEHWSCDGCLKNHIDLEYGVRPTQELKEIWHDAEAVKEYMSEVLSICGDSDLRAE
jgi:hypothetical protein